jgi:hypothetical protein
MKSTNCWLDMQSLIAQRIWLLVLTKAIIKLKPELVNREKLPNAITCQNHEFIVIT